MSAVLDETEQKILEDLIAINANKKLSNPLKVRAVTGLFFATKPTNLFVVGRMMLMIEKYTTDDYVNGY